MTGAALLALVLAGPGVANGQCLLVNPSFELTGSGTTFGGWYQFGPTGMSSEASHGHRAARVSGPNNGQWDVAGFWQPLEASPGEAWTASVKVWNTAGKPLSGGSVAILNIEWRDAGSNLISYESFTVADASSPTGTWIPVSVVSGPAPTGTAQTRILLAVLQGPADPQPEVRFDQATFDPAGPPTLDDIQWNDFGGGRTLAFSGRTWRVKGPGYYGPGPNLFTDSASAVWVDAGGRLHLKTLNIAGQWYSSEVALQDALGYGDYVFTTVGRLDQLDPAVVFGLFLWQYGWCWDAGFLWWNPFNEIDIEFSRWGNPSSDIAQFVAQPYDYPGNITRFDAAFSDGEITSHAFRWEKDQVTFRSWRGGPQDETPDNSIQSWTYTGPHIPRPEQPRVHLNLWRPAGPPAAAQEVVLDQFTFNPDPATLDAPASDDAPPPALRLAPAQPNPFAGSTRIRYALPREAAIELAVYDVTGRRVRTLERGTRPAGTHEALWDGTDAAGVRSRPGVYLIRLSAGARVETGRVVLLR